MVRLFSERLAKKHDCKYTYTSIYTYIFHDWSVRRTLAPRPSAAHTTSGLKLQSIHSARASVCKDMAKNNPLRCYIWPFVCGLLLTVVRVFFNMLFSFTYLVQETIISYFKINFLKYVFFFIDFIRTRNFRAQYFTTSIYNDVHEYFCINPNYLCSSV